MAGIIISLGPWNWLIAGMVLLGLELIAPGMFLLWLGIAALAVGIDDPRRLGQGLGTEAIRLVAAYAFDVLGLRRLSLHVLAFNTRAIRSYESCGFVVEGRERRAALIDGDAIATLKPGDKKTPAFTAIRDRLAAFRDANPGVIYVYTMRNVNGTVEYVVDADYGSVDTPGIGEVCNDTGAAMLAGFKEASAESAFVTEQWGNETATVLSGYAPIRDAVGAVVGLVGVDMGIVHES